MTRITLERAINELKRSDQVIQSLCPKGYIHPVLGSIHAAIADFQEALAQPEKEPVAWPCLIDSADFSANTITLVMQCEDYKVSAGTHWLSTTPLKENQ